MSTQHDSNPPSTSRQAEQRYLQQTLTVVRDNLARYGQEVSRMQEDIDEMLAHYHDNDVEVLTILNNTVTLHDHMKRALLRNEKAQSKPYFGRIIFHDEALDKEESLYIGKGGIGKDSTHQIVIDWRAPVANAYYENGLGKCSYKAPGGTEIAIDLKLKRTYEIEEGKLLDYFDSEVIANDDLLTKYLAKNKQAVLSEIVATIQKEQNEIIRKSPYHNIIVQGVAGSGKTTVAMHRISYILYNYAERFRPDDFYIVGSNRILLDYITGVLPDLDVYGVRQMTMEQLFVRLLYEDWDASKYTIKSTGGVAAGKRTANLPELPAVSENISGKTSGSEHSNTTEEQTSRSTAGDPVKGSSAWFHALEQYCNRLEETTISRKSVYLNPKQFKEGLRDGKFGVFDITEGRSDPRDLVCLLEGDAVERYLKQNPAVSIQSKINMLNERLRNKIQDEFLGKGIKYTEVERKAIMKAYRRHYGGRFWKKSIYDLYADFLHKQNNAGANVTVPDTAFDVYDLAALAYLYKRVKETEVISEAHHIVIDEAQDFGMMAYLSLDFCIHGCTYTVMGDVSQNIHFGYGLNDWEALRSLLLTDPADTFGLLKKSYRNTVEISDFATHILRHGRFFVYPVEPILRHGDPVQVQKLSDRKALIRAAADICQSWLQKGLDTIAVICRNMSDAAHAATELSQYLDGIESDLEKAVFGNGVMALPVEYTKGLEFDAVLILNPTKEDYPVEDGHAKLLYVAATRALHELCVLHTGELTRLITDPIPSDVSGHPDNLLRQTLAGSTHDQRDDTSGTSDKHLAVSKQSVSCSNTVANSPAPEEPIKPERPLKKKISIVRNQLPRESAPADDSHSSLYNPSGTSEITGYNKTSIDASEMPGRNRTATDASEMPSRSRTANDTTGAIGHNRTTASAPGNIKPVIHSRIVSTDSKHTSTPPAQAVLKNHPGTIPGSASALKKPQDHASLSRNNICEFGDMPATEKLRPAGHGKIDLAVRWVIKQPDGLYLHSRYGILRITPIGSAIMRITFARGTQIADYTHPGIDVRRTERTWMYKESGNTVDLMTDELLLQVEKSAGAVRYMTRDKKLLLAERSKECRQLEASPDGRMKVWLYPDWQKNEAIYAMGAGETQGMNIRKTARYISHRNSTENLPLLLSDKGYGIIMAADSPVISCDIPSYGSYLYAESEVQMDYYFLYGKRSGTILNAYAYLCGKL